MTNESEITTKLSAQERLREAENRLEMILAQLEADKKAMSSIPPEDLEDAYKATIDKAKDYLAKVMLDNLSL